MYALRPGTIVLLIILLIVTPIGINTGYCVR